MYASHLWPSGCSTWRTSAVLASEVASVLFVAVPVVGLVLAYPSALLLVLHMVLVNSLPDGISSSACTAAARLRHSTPPTFVGVFCAAGSALFASFMFSPSLVPLTMHTAEFLSVLHGVWALLCIAHGLASQQRIMLHFHDFNASALLVAMFFVVPFACFGLSKGALVCASTILCVHRGTSSAFGDSIATSSMSAFTRSSPARWFGLIACANSALGRSDRLEMAGIGVLQTHWLVCRLTDELVYAMQQLSVLDAPMWTQCGRGHLPKLVSSCRVALRLSVESAAANGHTSVVSALLDSALDVIPGNTAATLTRSPSVFTALVTHPNCLVADRVVDTALQQAASAANIRLMPAVLASSPSVYGVFTAIAAAAASSSATTSAVASSRSTIQMLLRTQRPRLGDDWPLHALTHLLLTSSTAPSSAAIDLIVNEAYAVGDRIAEQPLLGLACQFLCRGGPHLVDAAAADTLLVAWHRKSGGAWASAAVLEGAAQQAVVVLRCGLKWVTARQRQWHETGGGCGGGGGGAAATAVQHLARMHCLDAATAAQLRVALAGFPPWHAPLLRSLTRELRQVRRRRAHAVLLSYTVATRHWHLPSSMALAVLLFLHPRPHHICRMTPF